MTMMIKNMLHCDDQLIHAVNDKQWSILYRPTKDVSTVSPCDSTTWKYYILFALGSIDKWWF